MTDTTGPHFVLGGRINGTSTDYEGSDSRGILGVYISSSSYSLAPHIFLLGVYGKNSAIDPTTFGYNYYGRTLRCLAQ